MNFIGKNLCILVFLLTWELLSRLSIINPVFFPPVTVILQTLFQTLASGIMVTHLKVSLLRALSGFVIATLLGVPLGLLLGTWFKKLNAYLDFPLEILSQLNPFILFHILILFLGIGESPKITIVAWTCLWPVTFSAINGAKSVSPLLLKAGRAFGLNRFGILIKIVVPQALPLIFAGIRLSLGYSLFMLIAAEMMGASSGLGFLTLVSQENFQLNRMYAAVVMIACLGIVLDYLLVHGFSKIVKHPFYLDSLS